MPGFLFLSLSTSFSSGSSWSFFYFSFRSRRTLDSISGELINLLYPAIPVILVTLVGIHLLYRQTPVFSFLRLQHPPRFQTSTPHGPANLIHSNFPSPIAILTPRPKGPPLGHSGWIVTGPDNCEAETNLVSLRHTRFPGEKETPHTPWTSPSSLLSAYSLLPLSIPFTPSSSTVDLRVASFYSNQYSLWVKSVVPFFLSSPAFRRFCPPTLILT